ncbi:MAG TPA: M28 family peptidase [Gemmatimonadales bacterium]|jgi:Zn-dependent M28 family amino/carboxypeptidase
MRLILGILASATIAANGSPLPAQAPRCAAPAIDSALLLHDDGRLSDDSMRGRYVGTPGNARARDFIAARFDALGLTLTSAGRILPFAARAFGEPLRGANVAGIIRGTSHPDQYIAVTAHFDHIGTAGHGQCRAQGGDSICNGADDNASGTAGILALAAWFMRHPPAHSLLFVAFDAEEEDDVGSQAFVANPPVALDSVLVDVNLDMVGRNAKNELYAAGPDRFPAFRPLVVATAACTPIHLLIGHDGAGGDDWTEQSDQDAFFKRGIPFVYFGEEDHPDYHRPGDQVERLMPGFFAAAVRAAGDLVQRFDAAPVPRRR